MIGAARISTSADGTYRPDPAGKFGAVLGVHAPHTTTNEPATADPPAIQRLSDVPDERGRFGTFGGVTGLVSVNP